MCCEAAVPASAFRNKHVVIGTNATGLAIPLATPSGPDTASAYHAQLLGHILQRRTAKPAHCQRQPMGQPLVERGAWSALGLAGAVGAGPLGRLAHLCRVGAADLAGAHWPRLRCGTLALSPAAALLALTLAYPLWSWRRLNAAARFLNQEMQGLRLQGLGTPNPAPSVVTFCSTALRQWNKPPCNCASCTSL